MDNDDVAKNRERFWLHVLAVGCALFWLGAALEWYFERPLIDLIWQSNG